ncbi:hypothetical protein EST38_g14041 [Candolleomyces aberdarensis]|uniref:Uncharacterized protein n=1 Tax=Candolleomyces aberdarensis TaxID=2316362 RepID=A0A4Q2D0R1_9AGAR|nr:hypothetical protein EST38_g14041 [Candolleomyces aberdarensis]
MEPLMARRWASDPQWDWLVEQLPEYLEATRLGRKKEFFEKHTRLFIEKFSLTASEEAVRALGLEAATQATWDLYSSRIENWFPNNTRANSTAGSGGKRGTLEGKKKLPQHWQVYQSLYWDKGLEERANAECVRREGKGLTDIRDSQKRFAVRNRIVVDMYKAESEEVRRNVDLVREGHRSSPLTNDDIVKNLGKLPRTLKKVGATISTSTEWSGVMVFGGPHPSYGGKNYTVVRCVGTTKNGQTFDEFLGSEEYGKWVGQLDTFFNACYDGNDSAERSTNGTSAMDQSPRNEGGEGSSNDTAAPSITQRGPPVKSEYEKTREINIARNKVVLGILNRTIGSGDETEILVEELKKVGIVLNAEELKSTLEKIKSLCSLSKPAAQTTSGSTSSSQSATSNAQPTPTDHNVKTEGKGAEAGTLPKDTPVDPPAHANSKNVDVAGETSVSALPTTPPTSKTIDIASEASVPASSAIPPNRSDDAMDVDQLQNPPPATTPVDKGSQQGGDIQGNGSSKDAASEPRTIPRDVDHPSEPAQPFDIDIMASVPTFLKATWKYLVSTSETEAWRSLISFYAQFEAQSSDAKRMNTNGRPKQVQAWMKSHNKTTPQPLDLAVYSPQTLGWWKINQPEWRTVNVDGISPINFCREVPNDADWSSLARGGSAGIYTVVMALSWWVRNTGSSWSKDLSAIVDDVTWVLRTLVQNGSVKESQATSTSPGKRAQHDDNSAPTRSSGRPVKRPRRDL